MANAYASASLYVGDLRSDVTEAQLFDFFKSVGPVASIRVCRDLVTKRSLGYAYVNFHQARDAERALDTLNFYPINTKPCRIMWSHRDPSRRKSGVGNIFIKNLEKSIDVQGLYDTFSAFGNINSCKVESDENGISKGYGYINYETDEQATKAIEMVNGKMISNKIVYVGRFIPKKERSTSAGEVKFTNVYVKNLDKTVTEEELRTEFEKFGEITSCVIMKESANESRGFGFVNFLDSDAARSAVESMDGVMLKEKQMCVCRAQKKSEREAELRKVFEQRLESRSNQGENLFIKNLDDTVDDDELRNMFTKFGTITSAKVMYDDKNNTKGFGFVCFSTRDEAMKAVQEMNGCMVHNKPIYVALAQKKDVRKAQLEAQYKQKSMNRMQPGMPGPIFPPGMYFHQQSMPPQRMLYQQPAMVPPRSGAGWGRPNPQQGNQVRQQGGYQVPGANGNHFVVNQGQAGVPRQQRGPGGNQQGGMRNNNARGAQNQQDGAQPLGFKYTSTARNQPAGFQQPTGEAVQEGSNAIAANEQDTTEAAAPQQEAAAEEATREEIDPEDLKQALGERIYNTVYSMHEELAGKLTGMLLDSIPPEQLQEVVEEESVLNSKIQEAYQVFQEHQRAESGEAAQEEAKAEEPAAEE